MKQIVFLDVNILPENKDWQKLTDAEVLEYASKRDGSRRYGIFYDGASKLVKDYNHGVIPTSDNWVAYAIEKPNADYKEMMAAMKESIIADIIALMQNRSRLVFDHSRDFRMAYLDYSYNPSAEVLALNIDGGKLIADIKWIAGDDDVESFSGKTLFTLDSLIALKSELMYYIRYEKLEKLRKLVESAGGNIKFDGSFKFIGKEQMADGSTSYFDDTELYGLSIKDGKLSIDDVWEGELYDNDEDFIDTDSIDSLLEYVEKEVEKRKFTIKASRGMSRTFEIVADSYEKALEIAKAEMQKVPFYDGDIDWDEIA